MRLSHDRLALLAFLALTAACSQPAESAARTAPAAPQQAALDASADADSEVDADEAIAADMPGIRSPEDLVRATRPNLVTMAAAMSAAAEFCGTSTRAQAAAGLPKMKARLAAQGGGVERQFWTAYDATLAEARKASPAKMKADCDQMRALADPAAIRKLEDAAREMEALQAKRKAQGG